MGVIDEAIGQPGPGFEPEDLGERRVVQVGFHHQNGTFPRSAKAVARFRRTVDFPS